MGRRDELLDLPGDLPGEGVDRRDFVKVCMMAAAALGLPAATGVKWAEAAERTPSSAGHVGRRPKRV